VRGATEKDRKIAKKGRKIALLSFYYICTMYENPGGARPPAADAHKSNQICPNLINFAQNILLGMQPHPLHP